MPVSFRPENSDSMVSRTTRLAPTVRIAYPSLTNSPSSDFVEAADAGEGFRELSARGKREQHAETLTARQGQSCHVLHTLVAQTLLLLARDGHGKSDSHGRSTTPS